jgi:hypothetical protein
MFTSILILRHIKIEWDRLKEERKGVLPTPASPRGEPHL